MFGFEVSGGGSLSAAFDKEIKRGIEETIVGLERTARSVRCRAHGRPVTTRRGRSGGDPTIEIDGCCQEAIDRASALL